MENHRMDQYVIYIYILLFLLLVFSFLVCRIYSVELVLFMLDNMNLKFQ